MGDNRKRKQAIAEAIEGVHTIKFCGPSGDPDEQTGLTSVYRHLVIQLKRLAAPLLPPAAATQLESIDVEINNIYSVYEAHSEVVALLPDIQEALERLPDDGDLPFPKDGFPMIANERLAELRALSSPHFDYKKLIRLCEEINTSYSQKCYYATAMLTRGVLDHVPPTFGCNSFSEVANNYPGGKSFKAIAHHLEHMTRKVADAHLHTTIRNSETLPTAQQVNAGQELDVLLAEIVRITK
jgi:hypothetical protein